MGGYILGILGSGLCCIGFGLVEFFRELRKMLLFTRDPDYEEMKADFAHARSFLDGRVYVGGRYLFSTFAENVFLLRDVKSFYKKVVSGKDPAERKTDGPIGSFHAPNAFVRRINVNIAGRGLVTIVRYYDEAIHDEEFDRKRPSWRRRSSLSRKSSRKPKRRTGRRRKPTQTCPTAA